MHPPAKLHLILIGMMGSGKSSVARLLSHQHNIKLIDTDHEIEKHCGCTIPELFSSRGEPAFRELEHELLQQKVTEPNSSIFSTGGGTVILAQNRELLWKSGFVVYLKAEPATLLQRIAHDRNRPLLQQGDPLTTITRLLQERESFYDSAHLTLQVDRMSCRQVASRVWSHFSKRRAKHESSCRP
jgi:shikimate kinase